MLTLVYDFLQLPQSSQNLAVFLCHHYKNEHLLHLDQHECQVKEPLTPIQCIAEAHQTVQH